MAKTIRKLLVSHVPGLHSLSINGSGDVGVGISKWRVEELNGVMVWCYLDGSDSDSGCENKLTEFVKSKEVMCFSNFLFIWL